MHPHKMLLLLGILGSSLIFLFLLIGYVVNKSDWDILFRLPRAFTISTLILLISSFVMARVLPLYNQERINPLLRSLGITLILGGVFLISQFIGWRELFQSGFEFSGEVSVSYIYILSGIHLFHLIGCLAFLCYQFVQIWKVYRNPVGVLIMVTNPYGKIKMEMLTIYWHFLDISWIVIFLFFLFTF